MVLLMKILMALVMILMVAGVSTLVMKLIISFWVNVIGALIGEVVDDL